MSEPTELEIFEYHHPIANRTVYADPMVIHRRLTRVLGKDIAAVVAESRSDEDGRAEQACQKLRIAVCTAFDLGEPFDQLTGKGVLEAQWSGVFKAYTQWLQKKSLKLASTPTLPASTASKPCNCHTPGELPSGTTSQGFSQGLLTPTDEALLRQLAGQSAVAGQTPSR